ncbi:uncharacterized protein BKCO1_4800072 [Diplodia corticola]|uniref:Fucose-specific lectin n=1 Tax=Diplodia corticola TaxID=236234 RepID=A0A1J9RVB6_9PEZI|nr:uncharacterized protein BKCO1_4800072 [Diplodia corticola]OJD31445.1 hypothetical protein BKCO1_4800072 [Diplodia corticola]
MEATDNRPLIPPATSIAEAENISSCSQIQPDNGLPQVVASDFPEVAEICYPQVIDTSAPEALNRELPEVTREKRDGKTRRKRLWLILGTIAFLAVAVGAVIGGVLGSRTKTIGTRKPAQQPSMPPQLLPSTSLVSFNYTDNDGTEHRRLLFQKTDGVLYQSAWNSSSKSWVMSAVSSPERQQDPGINLDVKHGTPLAGGTRNFHFFYLDNGGAIRELFAENDADGLWKTGPSDNKFKASSASRLAWYVGGQKSTVFALGTEFCTQYLLPRMEKSKIADVSFKSGVGAVTLKGDRWRVPHQRDHTVPWDDETLAKKAAPAIHSLPALVALLTIAGVVAWRRKSPQGSWNRWVLKHPPG